MLASSGHGRGRVGAFLIRGLVIVTAGLLLTSLGGAAIFAAPLTLPVLLAVSVFSRERSWRHPAAIVAGLTALEVAWAGAWTVTEHGLISIAAGLIAGLAVGLAFWHARPSSASEQAAASA